MRIKSKLIFSFIGIAFVSIFISSYIVVNTVNNRAIRNEKEKIKKYKREGEIFFYDQLSDIKRIALIISSFEEIAKNIENIEELYLILSSKAFIFDNINIRIISSDKKSILFTYKQSESSPVKKKILEVIPFIKNDSEPYLRKSGIFFLNNNIYFIAISPIVDKDTFDIKGFLLLEKKFNTTFANILKEKLKTEIIVFSKKGKKIASTITSNQKIDKSTIINYKNFHNDTPFEINIGSSIYYATSFPIKDYYNKNIGEIFLLDNISNMIVARKLFYNNLFIIFFSLSIFLIIIGFLLARKISNPILNLSKATKELSKGNFDIIVKKTSNDEIGELTEVFNRMVESFKIQKNQILSLQKFSENIVKSLTLALIVCDENFNIIIVNNEAEKLFLSDKEKAINKNLFSNIVFFNNFLGEIINVLSSGMPRYFDNIEYKDLNSEDERILRIIIYRMIIENKKYVLIQAEDITKRIRIEEKLTQANKLVSVGELLSKFTHENSNIISGILGNLEILKMKIKDDDINDRVRSIEKLVKKSLELSDNILDFSRKRKIIIKKILIRDTIEEIIKLLKPTVLKNIDIVTEYPGENLYIKANDEKISVVIMNILINAKDAIEEAKREKGIIKININSYKNYLELKITDNGIGIEKNRTDNIFDSFYTTKGEKGTGLGLSNVKDIVEEVGGYIKVESELGKGTSFYVYFPIVQNFN